MGGLRHRMKTTYYVYMIGGIALAGLPPLAGFWSKDEILLEAQSSTRSSTGC
jgi:NADH-quinone oxidoreductase subunit L